MRTELHILALVASGALLCPSRALADASPRSASFAEQIEEEALGLSGPAEEGSVEISGYFRSRGEVLYNFDLDRGLTPSGQPLFPIPLGDPEGQALTGANMRLRTDLRFRAPGTGLSAVLRTDVLDNLTLGSTPDLRGGSPAASTSQDSPLQAFRIKRAYGEAVLPIGVLSVGRQGSHWGLGMVANSGDCEDCDGGDAADRISFVTPLIGHIFAAAYDISATGPQRQASNGSRAIDLEPTDNVQNLTFAFLRYHTDMALERRGRAGRTSVEYGAYVSHRWQDRDVPADYLGLADAMAPGPGDVVLRGFSATASDLWLRLTTENLRVELETAWLRARVDQSSLVPGVEFYEAATSNQFAAAMQSELRLPIISLGLDAGFASGDPSPGFGAFPDPNAPPPQPGDLDGAQANLPFDTRIDNFRFHPDYRIDRILFREIIGTVTDAIYLRPHLGWTIVDAGAARLSFDAAAIMSWAAQPASTPSGERPLGFEVDPSLRYQTRDGFVAALDYAVLLPLGAFDNPAANLDARAAQLIRLRLGFSF